MSDAGPFGRRDPEGSEPEGSGTDGAEEVRHREDSLPPPRPPRGLASNATWIAGVGVVLLLAAVTINGIRTKGPGATGLRVGAPLPVFAAPLALSDLEGDANVAVEAGGDVRHKACDVRGPKVFNVCELRDRGPVALVFTVTKSKKCEDQVDVVDRLTARFPEVGFAAVAIKGDRDDVRKLVRERGWKLPVAYDHDGAVANIYGVAICPTMTLAGSDGNVTATALGFQSEAQLVRRLEALR